MCVVTGPITIDPELLGETVFLVSGRSSLAGHPGQGNSHFKKGEAMLNTKEWIPGGGISGHGRYFHPRGRLRSPS